MLEGFVVVNERGEVVAFRVLLLSGFLIVDAIGGLANKTKR